MAALAVAVVVAVIVTLPAPSTARGGAVPPALARGAIHVHTDRSDGSGSVRDVARAAAEAGLDFVILTDHGDGTREPLAPALVSGVLVIDALEVSTTEGHVLALGLTGPTPYPLGGAARDVVDDVHRFGGIAIAAHPDSPKDELRWRAQGVQVDGFEWLNADSEWRDESAMNLAAALLRGLIRGPESVASLFGPRPRRFARWSAGRRMHIAIAGHDAHGGAGNEGEARDLIGWLLPGYRSLFSTFAQVVELDVPLSGQPDADAARVVAAIGQGRTYTVVGAFASPAVLSFVAHLPDGRVVPMGGVVPSGPVRMEARITGDEAALMLMDRGRRLADGHGSATWEGVPGPEAAIWVEARWPGRDFPWVVSNPIFGSGRLPEPSAPLFPGPAEGDRVTLPLDAQWQVEHDAGTVARTVTADAGRSLEYTLSRGPSPYAALVLPIEGRAGYREVVFDGWSASPIRVSVQVRLPGRDDGQRWGRSVALDRTSRTFVLPLEDFEPIGHATSLRPVTAEVRSLLFVVDTVNAHPGATGSFTLRNVALGVGAPGLQRP